MQETKTIREKGQWVKITRGEDGTFYFARGDEGNLIAHDKWQCPRRMIPTWDDAIAHAKYRMEKF